VDVNEQPAVLDAQPRLPVEIAIARIAVLSQAHAAAVASKDEAATMHRVLETQLTAQLDAASRQLTETAEAVTAMAVRHAAELAAVADAMAVLRRYGHGSELGGDQARVLLTLGSHGRNDVHAVLVHSEHEVRLATLRQLLVGSNAVNDADSPEELARVMQAGVATAEAAMALATQTYAADRAATRAAHEAALAALSASLERQTRQHVDLMAELKRVTEAHGARTAMLQATIDTLEAACATATAELACGAMRNQWDGQDGS